MGDPELSRARDQNSPGERGWDGTACMGCRASAWEALSCLIFFIHFCKGFLIWYHQARLLSASQVTHKLEKRQKPRQVHQLFQIVPLCVLGCLGCSPHLGAKNLPPG